MQRHLNVDTKDCITLLHYIALHYTQTASRVDHVISNPDFQTPKHSDIPATPLQDKRTHGKALPLNRFDMLLETIFEFLIGFNQCTINQAALLTFKHQLKRG